ncbi:S-layer family protein [Sphingomonas sp. R-74633]|uniref:S-layer family protein n=1 Tax=Sphingomonas sp. R-74633 TaxID=2751188 RepID=UPI0015D32F3C|nr:S-layer family protein [Sphingomonas sp. R-74633]NYT40306.1 S-layer family protein [Sphingomonas sp. R-74633]
MNKLHRGRLLLSTCLTGIALAAAPGAHAQDKDPNWQPRAEVDARAADGSSQVSFELFAPVAQNDTSLMFVAGRIGTDERYDRNGSVTIGGRGKIGEDVAIGVNAGVDFYKSDLSKRDVTAASFGLEAFTSVFDLRLNYRLPVTNRSTIGFLDPNASPAGVLSVENNRLIERKSGWRLEDVPMGGANGEIGATAPLGKNLSVRASAAGFDYRDDAASKAYRGVRGGLELGVEDPLGTGGRFSLGAELQNDNRWGTQARGTIRLSIPLGHGSRDRSAGNTGLDRQMGDRIRRDYVSPSGTRYTDLTSTSFAVDARTGAAFGGVYYVNGAAAAAGAGTSAAPTTLGDAVTRAGANGIVVALGNAGNIASGGVTLATNQYLVGGASSVDVRHSNGTVTAFSFGGSNGTIVGNNALGASVTLGQGSVVRDVTVRGSGSGILANGVGGFSLERVTIENTGAAGLTLTNTTGAVVIDGITVRGGAGVGVVVNGGSNVTLRNSTIGGGAGAIDINDAGGNLTTTLSSLTLSATGGNVLDIDGSGAGTVTVAGLSGINIAGGNGETGGFAARFVTFDSSTTAGIQAVNAGTMQVGTTAARLNGAGVSLTEVDGALSFATLNIANNGGTGLTVNNTKSGTFTLTNTTGTVDTTAGTALNLDPLLIDLNFTAVRSIGAAGAGIILSNVQGAGTGGNALAIGTLTITNSGQQGLYITGGSTGLVTIGGGTITNSGGASVQLGQSGVVGSGGTIGLNFGAAISDTGAGPLVSIFNIGGAIRFTGAISGAGPITIDGTTGTSSIAFAGSTTITGASGTAISINNLGGALGFTGTVTITNPTGSGIAIGNTLAGSSVTFAGATTITGAASPALSLNNLGGSTAFTGLLTIANPAGTAIVIGTVPGGVTFGDVDITGLGAATGVNLTGTQGNVTFGTLDITGTGAAGSTGIDMTGASNAGAIAINNPSVIQGVDIGVNLTNAHITGSFRFGDGNATGGLQSRITANTVIVVAGMDATHGTYNFADVQLDGNTNNITGGSFTAYYVLAGATGAGTATDPGSIAGAAASGAQYIVLLNNPAGGQDVIDTTPLGGSLNLGTGQSLVSFLYTDFFAVTGATVPANLIVSNLGPTGITNTYTGSGAAILSGSGGVTVNLTGNNARIDGVIIQNTAGVGVVSAGVSNAIIQNSNISGAGGAISITDGGAAASATLTNLNLSASGGTALALSGAGAGTLNVSGTGINVAATGAAQGLVVADVTVGTLDIGSVTTGNAAGTGAVQVTQAAGGTVNIGSVAVGGTTAGVGLGIANNSATVNVGAVTTTNTAGIGVVVSGNTGNVTLGAITATNSGSDGVRVTGNSGNVALGAVTATNAAGAGLRVSNTTGNVTVANASITGAASGIEVSNLSGNLTVGATSIANSTGAGILTNGVGGNATFGATAIANSAGIVLGAGSTGTIKFGDTDITGLGANQTGVDARSSGGTVSFATLDITGTSTTGTRGIDLTGATFAGSLIVSDSSTITGVGTGIDLTNAAITGSFRFGDGSNTDADGAHSTINAITPIAIGGLNQGVGTYNLSDVALIGDTTNLATNPVTLFFVEAGRTGTGTMTDPGSLAAALAANASVIVLLNNPTGGNDVLDVAGLGTFTLDANQRMIGFLNGDTQTVGGGTPANLFLYGITPGIVTNPYAGSGAALLTNTGAGATITLSTGSSLDGLRIGGAGIGVSGIGTANVSITNSVISGGTGAIMLRDGGAAASATLTNLALSSTGGTALNLLGTNGGTLSLSGSGLSIAATGNARGVAMDTVTLAGNLGFTTVSTLTSAGSGVSLANNIGTGGISFTSINVGGTSSLSGVRVVGNSTAINLGNVTVGGTTGAGSYGIEVANNPGNVTLGTFNISNTGAGGLLVFGMPGTFTAAGGTVTNSGTMGIGIGDVDGSVTFTGAVTITNPGTAGVAFNTGSTGTINFADVDILGVAANRRGVDARLASGNITFGTLDITGASATGTRGIDLTGATFSGNLIIAGSSTITGVGTGVDMTNAAITGNFRFGDGSNTDANGAGSTINATVPLVVAGLNAITGTYDFADVNLVGDTSSLATSVSTYWVLAGASGAGTRGDPGSLAGAAASGADVVILVNNPAGGTDTIDANDPTYGTGGTFTLLTGQQLRGFLNGDTITLPGGAPANVVLYNIAQGFVTNPFTGSGAPTLTTSAGGGANTVVVGNNTLIDGVVIANGGTGTGVYGSGASNVTIRNSNISGANSAIDFSDGGAVASLALSNLHLWASNSSIALAAYLAGGGSTTVTQLSNITIEGGHGEAGGAYFAGAIFDADTGTAGFQTVNATMQIGSAGTRVTGTGLQLANAAGALNLSALGIYNQGNDGLHLTGTALNLSSAAGTIDTVNGTTLSLGGAQTDLILDSIVHSGTGAGVAIAGLTGTGTGGRALQVGTVTASSTNSGGIAVSGNVNGAISFGAGSSIANTAGTSIAIASGTGTLDFTYDGSVTQSSNAALLGVSGHNGTITFGAASNLSATNGTGLQFSNADGTYAFNGTIALNGGDAGIDILAGSAGSFTFGTGTSITSPTGTAFAIADSTASVTYNGSITQANNAALVSVLNHSGGTIAFQTGTLSATGGTGLQFDNADGTYNFTGAVTLNGGDAGIDILNGSAGSVTLANGSITSPGGAAVTVSDSTASLSYTGNITQASNAALVSVLNHSGGTIAFSGGTLGATNGTGLQFDNADGTYNFTGAVTLNGGDAGIDILNGSAGTVTLANGAITSPSGAAVTVSDSTANLSYTGNITQASNAALVSVLNHSGGTIAFSGGTRSATGGSGLTFDNADGSYNLGDLALSGGARIALLNGSAGTFTFGNVDITGLAANTTAANLTGATGNVTFATLDITGASATGTRGIDMTGSTTAGNVIISGSSQITGVGIGVDLTNAAITGNFRYGDGSNTDGNGAASNITAVTPLIIAGLNGGSGTYNFADVNMNGDTTNLSVSAYFVLEGATGTGSRSDPGSLAGAEAAGATYIVLLNDPTGGNDTLDATANAGGSLDLAGGQILLGFRDTDSFTVGGGAPANVLLFNVQTGVISNPFAGSGAPTLTASGANATVTLGGGNIIDGVIIANSGTGAGVLGNGAAAPITIRNSTISGGAAGAIRIYDNAANVGLALSNLTLAANGGNILNLDGSGAGTFIVSQMSNLTVTHTTETGGFVFNDLTFDSDTVAAGIQAVNAGALTLGTTGSRITGTAFSLTNVTGTLNFTDLNIANNAGTGLIVANSKANNFILGTTGGAIDTTNGTAINLDPLTINMVLGSVGSTGGVYGILLDQVEGSFTVTGAVNVTGATNTAISVVDNTAQTDALDVHFQGAVTVANTSGAGVSLTNNAGATVDFTGGLGITTTTGAGFTAGAGTVTVTGTGNTITVGDASALNLGGTTLGAAGVSFDSVTAAPTVSTALLVTNATLTGALNIGGLHVTGAGTAATFNNLGGTGGVNLTGTLDLDTTGIGLQFSNGVGTINIANVAGSALTIDGASRAVFLNGMTSGTVNIASAAGTASIGATTSATTAAIASTGSAGTLNYGGTIGATAGSVLAVSNSTGGITLGGAITSTSGGTAFNFTDADGTYLISGDVSHAGGAGVAVDAASSGAITFSGAAKAFNTGTNTAVSANGTGTLAFTGGGLDIDTTSGTGFFQSGGTVTVTGAGNTITTGSAPQALGLGATVGAAGVTFDSITSAPAGGGIAVLVGGANLVGALNIGGLRVTGNGQAALFSGITGTGGINLTGTIDLDNSGIGLQFTNGVGTVNIANTAGSALTIDGASRAIYLSGMTGGTVNIASAAGTAAIGATTSSNVAAVEVANSSGGTLNYGGTIRATAGSVLSVTNSSNAVTVAGTITSTTSGTAFNFNNADGTYLISGAVNHVGDRGVLVNNASSGTITFSGASKIFNTGAAVAAIDMGGTGLLAFTGGGLDIDTTSGVGFSGATGSITVSGAGNTITSGTGAALALANATVAAGGITFDQITAAPAAGTAVGLNGVTLTGALNIGGLTVSGGGNAVVLTNLTGAGGVNFTGATDIDGSTGFNFLGTVGTVNIANTAGSTLTIDGGTVGIAFNGVTSGTVNVASAAGTASIGASASTTTAAISASGDTGGTLNYGGSINVTTGNVVSVSGSTSTLNLGAGAITSTTSGIAFLFANADGVYNVGGTVSHVGGAGVVADPQSSGAITFSGASKTFSTGASVAINAGGTGSMTFTNGGLGITTTSGNGVSAANNATLVITGANNTISTTIGRALSFNTMKVGTGGINFATINVNGATDGIVLNGVSADPGATIALGTVNLQGITARGVDVGGTLAAGLTISDLDIGLNSGTAVAFDLNAATIGASITVGDFDVTNAAAAGTSIAVDLRGATGGAVRLGDASAAGNSSTIANVGTGIYLDGTTNLAFTYGDGEAGTDAASTISAITAIDATAAPASGSYDFRDVTFAGSPGTGFGVNHIYFVDSDGATGGGNGSGSDAANPMTLAAAELLAGAQDIIVLVNNGNVISAAGSNGNDSLVIASNVQVRGFGDGVGGGAGSGSAPIALTLTVPSTIFLSGGTSINIADPTGNGAATLTTAAGGSAITLGATGNSLAGFILSGNAGTASYGVFSSGGTGAQLSNLTVNGFAIAGIGLFSSTNATANNILAANDLGADIAVSGSGLTISNFASTGAGGSALNFNGLSGTTTLTNINITGAARGLQFASTTGTINATNVDVTNNSLAAISILAGTAAYNFDTTSSITQGGAGAAISITGGHSTGAFTYAGTINATNGTGLQFDNAHGTYNFTGTTTLNGGDAGVDILNGSDGTFSFGTGVNITHAAAGDAFVLTGSNANLTYSGNITDSNGYAVRIDNHDAGTVTFGTGTISSSGAGALGVSVTNSNGGTITFSGQTTLSTQANNALTLTGNAGGTIAFTPDQGNFLSLDVTTTSGTAFTIAGGGTINVFGSSNMITTGSGTLLDISNTSAVTSNLNLNFLTASNTLGANGILVSRTAGSLTGSVNISAGAITATNRGVDIDGGTLSLAYGGSITTNGTTARSVEMTNISGGSNQFSGNLTDTALGINVASNTGGAIAFYGQSIALNTVANANAVTLAGNTGTSITFSSAAGGNGVDIVASGTGNGIDFTGGGTLTVYSSGNSIQTANGQILNLVNGNVGTLGLVFDSLTSTGSTNGSAINISNVDGGTLSATTVSIAGTTGAAADGIFYGGGSTMNVNLGAVTIANTGDEGIEVNGTGNGTFTASSVTIDNTAGNGVEINNSNNTVTLNGGAIGGSNDPSGFGVYVLNGTGAVSIGASIAKTTAGNVVQVDNHETGTVTFSGNISATGAVDNGILVQNVNSGSVTFSGGTKTLTTGGNTAVDLSTNNTGGTISFTNGGLAITTLSGRGLSFTGGGTLNVTGSGNTVQTATGQILNLVNGSVGASGMTFDSLTSTGSTTGSAINISNLDGNSMSLGTVNIAGTTGAAADGIFFGGGSSTNVTAGAVTIVNTGDEGIEVNGAGNGTFSVTNATINNTGGNGVELNASDNSVTITGGAIGATNDPTGFGVYVLNGTGAVSIGAAITKTTANSVVFVDNHETGNVTFSGTISATGGFNNGIVVQNVNSGTISFNGNTTLTTGANTAVNLLNNTGGTISFPNGGLVITTTGGTGFSATGGGTVSTAGSGNRITSTSGTALNVVNTTIGSAGLRFQSISSNGAASGIILNNTGTSGGINVTGTGAAGSGGTIQNSTGDGISLTSTENVRLAYMNVTNNLGDGIGGSTVNGFVIDNMLISGNGDDAGTDESGINITNLSGTASNGARPTGIFNSTIQNNNEFEVQISNSTGTLTNFQVVNSTFASNGVGINGNGTSPHGNIFNFLGTGTSQMGISVSGSNFTGNWNAASPPTTIVGSGLFADSSGTSMTVQVSGSFFTNTNNGINVSTGPGSTTLTYNIDGNTFVGTRSTAINDFQNGNAPFTRTVNGRITNNIIGNNAVTNSGSNVGNGISIGNEGGVNANYLISGNTIQQIQTSQGIVVNVGLVGQATGNLTTNVTILNNTIRNINGSRGLLINNNQNTGGFPTVNVSVSGNGFSGIAGQAGNGQYMRLSASGGGTINVTQGQATASAIASELDDANSFNDTTKISIGTGTFNYGQPAPTQPPASVPLP